ncbi:hypothetical protein [Archaeoglobus sulfaticallidus]|uniref:hypothetical protein n=1 Tax=Archaeoglobus sulfaticallidus TaxID=1316941 RepID=UPI0014613769|nr:hypothetical protein [Archaeoglobus sulfaticallidus]
MLVLVLAGTTTASVVTQSTSGLSVSVNVPKEVKTNGMNYVTLTFEDKVGYQ